MSTGKRNNRVISGAFGKVYAVKHAVNYGPFQEVRLGRSTDMRDFSSQRLLQLRVLRLGFFQDGNIGIGVFPQRQEVLVGSACFGRVALE
jgi:hypothetical protein